MHRDLHLENVLHMGDDVMLGDFGTAKMTHDTPGFYVRFHTARKGLYSSLPPEARGGQLLDYSKPIDVYYFGHILLMLSAWALGMQNWISVPAEEAERETFLAETLQALKAMGGAAAKCKLAELIEDCGNELPADRPTARALRTALLELSSNV
jgi:serine/threonine protein kinase